ncbi:hypothetical protein CERSUDRAFT_69783 [Gelatoporia subvermispora B]|uniref:DNA-directed RNA polymerase n=1 Tax=Ceriporiopsis subvermispora (strain B) TaxID=914234 RepID=M2QVH4_CERS8|nr:hypothetical protein CERSUDRAFT_69783 [Gelatoporia subvermispora B]
MTECEGLVDTAIKIAETAYIQRHLVKAPQDVMVCYDATVRNLLADGTDGAFLERQHFETYALNDREFDYDYRVDVTDRQVGPDDSPHELQAKLDEEFAQSSEDHRPLRQIVFPLNLQRIVQMVHVDRRKPSDLKPTHIIDANRETFEWVLGEIEAKFNQSSAHPGEMCGTLAAQI